MKQPAGFTPPPGKQPQHLTDEKEEQLDEALRESFPASDPIAVDPKARPRAVKRHANERNLEQEP